MGKVILIAIVAFLAVTLLLVALLLFAKAKLTSSGKVSIDINDGKKVVEVEAGGNLLATLATADIFLPLIAVNCAIMGGSLFMQQMVGAGEINNFGQSVVYGLGSGIGWWIAIVMMAAIRERCTYSNIPAALKGPGIAFIITGLLGIAFMIFSGIQL